MYIYIYVRTDARPLISVESLIGENTFAYGLDERKVSDLSRVESL